MLQKLLMMFLSRGAGGGSLGALLGPLSGMLSGGGGGGGGGGLGDLLGKFQQAGLGGKADSWVGAGKNQRLSSREVRSALGDDEVARIAREAGVSERKAAGGLAAMLPQIVDKATPGGKLPDGGGNLDLGSLKSMLGF